MQEKDFKKLLVDTVKIGDHPDKEKIVNLQRYTMSRRENLHTICGIIIRNIFISVLFPKSSLSLNHIVII